MAIGIEKWTRIGDMFMALVIDVNSIPAFQRDALADMAIRLTIEYFKTPGVEEKYQEWLDQRERKESEEGAHEKG